MFHYALYIFPCSFAAQAGTRRGALAVVLNGVPDNPATTASFDRPLPLPSALQSNGTGGDAAYSVSLGDAGARVNATLVIGLLDSAAPCRLWVKAMAAATAAFSPTLTALRRWTLRGRRRTPSAGAAEEEGACLGRRLPAPFPLPPHTRSQVRSRMGRQKAGRGVRQGTTMQSGFVVPRTRLRHRWVHGREAGRSDDACSPSFPLPLR